jgi:hypothetical protein
MGKSLSAPMQTGSPAVKEVARIPLEGLMVKYTSSAAGFRVSMGKSQ